MNNPKYQKILSTLDDYDIYIFDLWGVIVEGDKLYPGVIETINEISTSKQVAFLSNAPRPSNNTFEKISSWGVNVSSHQVLTSGEIARGMMINHQHALSIEAAKIYHLGADRNADITIGLEAMLVDNIDQANMLLLTLYRDEHENLNEFNDLLKNAANKKDFKIICANPDTTIPNLGAIRYCSGYFAQKIEEYGGNVIYTGKPYAIAYECMLAQITNDVPHHRILMVGDTFKTDILGANRYGIHSGLVLTGNSQQIHDRLSNISDKIKAVTATAKELNIVPNLIIDI
ncbi:MAG: TIGR01459 family HAD-type hydrolase [Rickettsiaceae bacterium]|nr:MAG: TIGR01459 family HAD-type hydrolase [Rickettsiaceae bacterium]